MALLLFLQTSKAKVPLTSVGAGSVSCFGEKHLPVLHAESLICSALLAQRHSFLAIKHIQPLRSRSRAVPS